MPRPSDPNARNRLLEAAQRVFSKKGLDRAKVEEISELAGLSKGAFYLHFKSKAAVFEALLGDVIAHLQRSLDEAKAWCVPSADQSFEEALAHGLEKNLGMFEFIWKNRALMRITLEGGRSADHQHLIEHFAENVQWETAALLRQGVLRGMYRSDLDVDVTATFIAGGYDRFARQLVRAKTKPDIEKHLVALQQLVMTGAGTPALAQGLREFHKRRHVPGAHAKKPASKAKPTKV